MSFRAFSIPAGGKLKYELEEGCTLFLRQAALAKNAKSGDSAILSVNVDGKAFVVCRLRFGSSDQTTLDLPLTEPEIDVTLEGTCGVDLLGYEEDTMSDEDEDMEDYIFNGEGSEGESDESEESDEEAPEAIPIEKLNPTPRGTTKPTNGTKSPKASPALKAASPKLKAASPALKPSSPALKASSPALKAASPALKAASPKPKSSPKASPNMGAFMQSALADSSDSEEAPVVETSQFSKKRPAQEDAPKSANKAPKQNQLQTPGKQTPKKPKTPQGSEQKQNKTPQPQSGKKAFVTPPQKGQQSGQKKKPTPKPDTPMPEKKPKFEGQKFGQNTPGSAKKKNKKPQQ